MQIRQYPLLNMPGIKPPLVEEPRPAVVLNSQQVKQIPLQLFGGDIVVGPGLDQFIDVQDIMGNRATGFLAIGAVGTVQVSVNGGGFRTVLNDLEVNDAAIQNIRVRTGAASTVTIQLHGV